MRLKNQNGFTLIELLFTITIIGVLTAVAVPRYQSYVARAFDTRAKLELHNIALAQEAYFADTEHYIDCDSSSCVKLPGVARISKGVIIQITATPTGFTGLAKHPKGSREFSWDSSQGGLIE